MAKWASAAFLDGGLDHLKANGSKMVLIDEYSAGDSYATVVGNKLAEASMASGDYTLSSSGSNRVLTTAAGKSGVATAGALAGSNLHIAFTNGSSEVIYVTDETTDQAITVGNTVNFPVLTYTSNQPT